MKNHFFQIIDRISQFCSDFDVLIWKRDFMSISKFWICFGRDKKIMQFKKETFDSCSFFFLNILFGNDHRFHLLCNGLNDMLTYNIDSFKSWHWYRLDENNESAWGIHLVCSSAKASSINLTVQSHPPLPLPSVICITWYHPCALSGFIKVHDVWYYLGTYIGGEIYCFRGHCANVHATLPGAGWSFVRRFFGLLLMPQKPL